ncbi:MAG: HIG1 domain-containing protein [Sphingomonadaceae bacterium]|nr:HIG1 domain-containing protein [Sphingomonadaceae bacterium]
MQWLVILMVVGAAGMVLFSLIRGLIYFARTGAALQANGGDASEMHAAQNRMMFARVKWQAITILLLVLFGAIAASQ